MRFGSELSGLDSLTAAQGNRPCRPTTDSPTAKQVGIVSTDIRDATIGVSGPIDDGGKMGHCSPAGDVAHDTAEPPLKPPVNLTPPQSSKKVINSVEVAMLSSAQFAKLVRSKPVGTLLCVVKTASADTVSTLDFASNAYLCIGDGPVDVVALKQLLASFEDRFQPPAPGGVSGLVHTIPLQPGAQPSNQRPYRTPQQLLPELEKQVQELLARGWIRPSS
jgi:hypothetical protein